MSEPFNITLQTVRRGFDGQSCWVNPWAGVWPNAQSAVLTAQRLDLSGSDVFFGACAAHSNDGGATWSDLQPIPSMGRRAETNGLQSCVNDVKPHWHAASQRMLGIGVRVYYEPDSAKPAHVNGGPDPETIYTTCDPDTGEWTEPRAPVWPRSMRDHYQSIIAGSVQRLDLPDGRILLPVSCRPADTPQRDTLVVECRFDGDQLVAERASNALQMPAARGLYEPSLTAVGDQLLLTLRNDHAGYVARGDMTLRFEAPQPWTFDDGAPLGNYNTQQHWVTRDDRTWLVYTRSGLDNDHVMRHRAPLLIAAVDPQRPAVRRDSERVLVPERGARLGNFGVTDVSRGETWVTVAEWMQPRGCERHGSDNSVYIARLRWD